MHGRGVQRAHQLPKTHGVPAATIHLRAHHARALDLFAHFAGHAAAALGVPLSRPAALPTRRRLWTVLRGPFAHKKSQENFERRTHKRVLKAWDAHPEVVRVLVQYLERHVVPGVGMRAVRWERAPVGVGGRAVERAREGMRGRVGGPGERVKALGAQIVEQEMGAVKAAGAGAAAKKSGEVVKEAKEVKKAGGEKTGSS